MATHSDRRYYVYVIRLLPSVLDERKYLAANPNRRADRPCVYVGQSVKEPAVRYKEHVTGHKACKYVTRHHDARSPLLLRKCKEFDTRAEAEHWELELARILRKRGYSVWQR
jgi:hypothetical protein